MRGSNSVANLNPHTDLMSNNIDPYDPAMRASAYNPYGKLLKKPYLKTPSRLDTEYVINTRYKQSSSHGKDHYLGTSNVPSTINKIGTNYGPPPTSNTLYDTAPATPRTFHEHQIQKAMYQGYPGQKFTYAALNTEVENSIVQSMFPAVQPFHLRTSMNKIPTTRMSTSFLPNTQGKSGFMTSAYNPTGVKPTSRLQPLNEGIFEKDMESRKGPLPISALNQPSAIYIVHYANRNEECVVRYFMDTLITEK